MVERTHLRFSHCATDIIIMLRFTLSSAFLVRFQLIHNVFVLLALQKRNYRTVPICDCLKCRLLTKTKTKIHSRNNHYGCIHLALQNRLVAFLYRDRSSSFECVISKPLETTTNTSRTAQQIQIQLYNKCQEFPIFFSMQERVRHLNQGICLIMREGCRVAHIP